MGYTHYWQRTRTFGQEKFERIKRDFARLVPTLAQLGVPLAGPHGDGAMALTNEAIGFNGPLACGHARRDLGIAWPAGGTGGVCLAYEQSTDGDGSWFAGRQLKARTCDGDCSHETFWLPRELKIRESNRPEDGKYRGFCKTAYKPYDLAVQVCLVIAAHHLSESLTVDSDGTMKDWQDAIAVCPYVLGYGQCPRRRRN